MRWRRTSTEAAADRGHLVGRWTALGALGVVVGVLATVVWRNEGASGPVAMVTETSIATVPLPATTALDTTNAGTSAELAAQYDRCAAEALTSRITYVPARSMEVAETYDVEVLAYAANVEPAPKLTDADRSPAAVVEVALRCEVEAELYGRDFEVSPEGPRPRSFLDERVADWHWQVTPARPGRLELTLEVRSLATIQALRVPASTKTFRAVVEVGAVAESAPQKLDRFTRAVVTHPLTQLLGISSFAALGTFVLRRARERKRGGSAPVPPGGGKDGAGNATRTARKATRRSGS